MESKGLRVNMAKTKIMKCQPKAGLREKLENIPVAYVRRVSVQIQFFVRDLVNGFTRNVASVLENLKKILTSDVVCLSGNAAGMGKCKNGVELLNGDKIELVDFCYLGDMIGSGGGVEETSQTRVRCAWAKFRELSQQILTKRGVSLKIKGKLDKTCVQRVLVYASETWAMKIEDEQRLERAENAMIR